MANTHKQGVLMQQVFADAVSGLDTTPVVTGKQLAATRAAAKRSKALASIAHNTVEQHNVTASEYGCRGRWAKVTVLAPSTKGRNVSRATKGAKRAKRQNVGGNRPRVSATRWGMV